MRPATAIRTAAWGVVAVGLAVPVLRRRAGIPAPVVTAAAAAAPFALCVATPRTRVRDVATCFLQMYAYTVTYKMPADDPQALERRVHVDYVVRADRLLGLGRPPTLRLQERLSEPGRIRPYERVLVWAHWLWFLFPHGTVLLTLWRRPERIERTAALTYAVFDLGLISYWALPTAPPWYASLQGRLGEDGDVAVRRMMVEHGEDFWRRGWGPLYSLLGGNPFAAMPSLHFATSLMAAHLLAEAGPLEGAVGWTYALTLGFALVYLGEHYVVDLLAGAALTEGVRAGAPRVAPLLRGVARAVQSLEAQGPLMAGIGDDPVIDPIVDRARAQEEFDAEEMPRIQVSRRTILLGILLVVSVIAFLTIVLPQISGLGDTWRRIEQGDPLWLILAAVFTVLSFLGYVVLFRSVYVAGGAALTYAESYQVTMASLAASRLFAAGGAGGIALTAWAMRAAGMSKRAVADQTLAFLVLTYVVYTGALVICGFGMHWGIFEGSDEVALTVVPAVMGLMAIAVTLLAALTPTDLQRRLEAEATHHGRFARLARRLANVPAALSAGVRLAIIHVRQRDPALAGSLAYWGFNIAILWASFRAFGDSPPWAVIIMGFFVGMLANLLPLPGGVGGVDGGMIGAFVAFGVSSSLALVVVLTYRAFAFWLPTIPGALAYIHLRKSVARWRAQRVTERESALATAQP